MWPERLEHNRWRSSSIPLTNNLLPTVLLLFRRLSENLVWNLHPNTFPCQTVSLPDRLHASQIQVSGQRLLLFWFHVTWWFLHHVLCMYFSHHSFKGSSMMNLVLRAGVETCPCFWFWGSPLNESMNIQRTEWINEHTEDRMNNNNSYPSFHFLQPTIWVHQYIAVEKHSVLMSLNISPQWIRRWFKNQNPPLKTRLWFGLISCHILCSNAG